MIYVTVGMCMYMYVHTCVSINMCIFACMAEHVFLFLFAYMYANIDSMYRIVNVYIYVIGVVHLVLADIFVF